MDDELLRRAYADGVLRSGRSRSTCVDPSQLVALVEGAAAEDERIATLRHVGSCAHCRREFDLIRTAADAATGHAGSQWRGRALLVAASLVFIAFGFVLWQVFSEPGGNALRDGPRSDVQLLAPRGDVPANVPVTLVWSAVLGAVRYEVEILQPDGTTVLAETTGDTVLAVPDLIGLSPAGEYLWWVTVVLRDGSRARSTVAPLTISAVPEATDRQP